MLLSHHINVLPRSPKPSLESWNEWLDKHSPGNSVTEIYWDELRGAWVVQTTCGFWLER
jgi:hypothetical protein